MSAAVTLAFVGRLSELDATRMATLVDRRMSADPDLGASVAAIIDDVRTHGDRALRELAARFDGVQLQELEVPRVHWQRARAALPEDVRTALERAADNIAAFHRAQMPAALEMETEPGVVLGRRAEPLRTVGVYAPGGRAAYPSSVLMGVVPARVAGVHEVIVCSPPGASGLPPDAVLAAADIAGADRVFALGGAGAIAALALGTDTVPAADRIVGPGNAYVTEAKLQLARYCSFDSPAGPSEVLVIADDGADPTLIAAELLAQAEHDPDAACVLVCMNEDVLARTQVALVESIAAQPRRAIIERAFARAGALLVADDLDQAIAFAERFAPEHLMLMTRDPRALLPRVRNAGTIFLGAPSSVAFGDYITGANHVLPTAGLARAYAGLSTADFLRYTTYQEITPAAASRLSPPTAALARAEGLPAHAHAADLRATSGMADDAVPAVPLRTAYRAVSAYDPGRLPCALDLSDNTNLWGSHPLARSALERVDDERITRYPSVYADQLKLALAQLLAVDPANITTGCGSDDVIDSALRAFCDPADRVAHPVPTFGMVPIFARMNGAQPIGVPTLPDFSLDVPALLRTRAAATYVCRPNNPTGTLTAVEDMSTLDRDARGVVLLDEAYIDFADDAGCAGFAALSARTLSLRTLSKAYGFAGLRVGFAVGPAALITEVEKARGPYKVSAVAEASALAVLSAGRAWVLQRAAEAVQNRERLRERLTGLGLQVWPSAANFLLVSLPPGQSAQQWNRALRARGVAVRPFPDLPYAGECIRVTIGPWPFMETFLSAAQAVLDSVSPSNETR